MRGRSRDSDILEAEADLIVLPVDCTGQLGGSLALRAWHTWPHFLEEYRALIETGLLRPGRPQFAHLSLGALAPHAVLFPIAKDWEQGPQLAFIESCLVELPGLLSDRVAHKVVAIPKIGQHHPELDWSREIAPLFDRHLGRLDADLLMFDEDLGDARGAAALPLAPAMSDPQLSPVAAFLREHGLPGATLQFHAPTVDPRVMRLWVRNDEWLAHWRTLRALVDRTGLWPILLGSPMEVLLDNEWAARSDRRATTSVTQILKDARAVSAKTWFHRRASQAPWPLGYDRGSIGRASGGEPAAGSKQPAGFSEPTEPGSRRVSLASLGLIPTTLGWQAPAFLGWDTANYELGPAEHVRVMEYWWDLYGAEPVAMWNETIEMAVARPPTDLTSARLLAEEHYVYCPDRMQEVTSIEALAAQLLGAPVWHLWWD